MKRCAHVLTDGFHTCGSYAFNLQKEGIDQGNLCDVHYWQQKCTTIASNHAALTEQVAESWDGCQYDAPGESLDIGASIRRAFATQEGV